MLKVILIGVFSSTMLFASSTPDLLNHIYTTYSKKFYEGLFSADRELTLTDFESNSTQSKIKADFEKLLPKYLEIENPFTQEKISKLQEPDLSVYKSHFKDFITVSILYLNLQTNPKERVALLEKNLINLQSLMQNSKGMMNYILALNLYQKLYSTFKPGSEETYELLKSIPPPDKSIFFEKLEDEREWVLNSIATMNHVDQVDKQSFNGEGYKILMSQVIFVAQADVNRYFDKMVSIIKLESRDELKKFNQYIEEVGQEYTSYWNLAKFMMSTLTTKIYTVLFGAKKDYGFMAEYIGKTLALVAVPKLPGLYLDHIEMIGQYEKLLESSNAKI